MKKITSIVLAVALCLSLTLIFTSCSLFKHPIQRALDKIEEDNNYSITISVDAPLMGKEKVTVKLDGNAYHKPDTDTYIKICNDGNYVYRKLIDNSWSAYKSEQDIDVDPLDDYEEILDHESYEKVEKNIYKQKDHVKFDDFEDVVIEVIDDGLTIEAEMSVEGITCDIKVEIFDIGKTEVTLPQKR